jgi:hypothetical protein
MLTKEPSGETATGSNQENVGKEPAMGETKEGIVRALSSVTTTEVDNHIRNGLAPEQIEQRVSEKLEAPEVQRALIQEFSPYSEQINNHIRTLPELEIYQNQNLQENVVNGRPCLTAEINPQQTDALGTTNAERMAAGRAPVDENGDAMHLHHIGQKESSPLAELKAEVHQKCDSVLHDKTISSEVHGEGNNWNSQRIAHWSERSSTIHN